MKNIKNSTMLSNLIKMKKTKEKTKQLALSQILSTIIILLFTNVTTLKNLLNVLLIQNEMI